MNDVLTHAPGTVCWLDLATTDPEGAADFYSRVFGWSPQSVPGENTPYTLLLHEGRHVGGLYGLMPDQREANVPPHWMTHISVEDAEATAEQARALGGTVLFGPYDVTGADGVLRGRGLVLQDPTGAVFSAWQPGSNPGFGVTGEAGAHCWSEVNTTDAGVAKAFYTGLFGYTLERFPSEEMEYTILQVESREMGAAGLFQMDEHYGGMPSHWMNYFAVEDTDATAALIEELGGKITIPPDDIPGVGRFAVVTDPQGAVFAILKPVPMPA